MPKALIPGVLAVFGLLQLSGCSSEGEPGSKQTGAAGTSATGAAGTSASGAAGTSATGAAGTDATGTAGTSATGEAGTNGTGAAGTSATGTAGTSATGAAGTSATGTAGTSATGTAGSGAAGTGVVGGKNYPSGMSDGCGKPPAGAVNTWITKNVMVTVPATYQAMYASRKYYLRLPTNYNPSKPYPVITWGQGCGLANAENTPMTNADAVNYIQVLLQQVGGCFNTGPADSPDIAYFDVALKEVQDNNCTDKARVFQGGFSSGSWLTHMLGCHRANVLRGLGSASGGIGGNHHMCTGPVAAILTADSSDNENPIIATDSATGLPKGSAAARDRLLKENGCSMTETKPWDPALPLCNAYQGCNPLYPVVWCQTSGMGHSNGGIYSSKGFWKFWSSLMP